MTRRRGVLGGSYAVALAVGYPLGYDNRWLGMISAAILVATFSMIWKV